MKEKKHLTRDDRFQIEHALSEGLSFHSIASKINKDPSTVSKEIRNHLLFLKKGAPYVPFNDCRLRFSCSHCGDVLLLL